MTAARPEQLIECSSGSPRSPPSRFRLNSLADGTYRASRRRANGMGPGRMVHELIRRSGGAPVRLAVLTTRADGSPPIPCERLEPRRLLSFTAASDPPGAGGIVTLATFTGNGTGDVIIFDRVENAAGAP